MDAGETVAGMLALPLDVNSPLLLQAHREAV
jgi:hypothetical protein